MSRLKEGARIAILEVSKPRLLSKVQKVPLVPQNMADNIAKNNPIPLELKTFKVIPPDLYRTIGCISYSSSLSASFPVFEKIITKQIYFWHAWSLA